MRSAVLSALLLSAIGVSQGAGREARSTDPFAGYSRALEERLSEMVEAASAQSLAHSDPARASAIQIETAPPADSEIDSAANPPSGALARLAAIRPQIERILESEGVPNQLAAVVLVESGAQPYALSAKQARGLWQLIPATARQYGLRVGPELDERAHLEHATRAAARFLRDLYHHFGNWPLALAAYNAGPAAIEKAIVQTNAKTFSELSATGRLPEETRNYVPAVLAAMRLFPPSAPVPDPHASQAKRIYASFAPSSD